MAQHHSLVSLVGLESVTVVSQQRLNTLYTAILVWSLTEEQNLAGLWPALRSGQGLAVREAESGSDGLTLVWPETFQTVQCVCINLIAVSAAGHLFPR